LTSRRFVATTPSVGGKVPPPSKADKKIIMTPSNLCFRAAMLLVLAGMLWGLQMAITDDHSAFPAHAHLNLLGFVALFLFGIFYRLNPTVEANRLALPQVWIWIFGTIVMAIGVGLVHTGRPMGDPIAAVGSVAIFADAIVFTWLVFQASSKRVSHVEGRARATRA
jgi:hypothetical protein